MSDEIGSYFAGIPAKIEYEGKRTRNPFAFRHYNPEQLIEGKSMRDHLRFSVVYWHTMRGNGSDMFGGSTMIRPWEDGTNSIKNAVRRFKVFSHLMGILGTKHWAFHDVDLFNADTFNQTTDGLNELAKVILEEQERVGFRPLWGTANKFSHRRYVHGASTSPHPEVYAHAAAQDARALELTQKLGGEGYTFWGGREGYQSLLNVKMQFARANYARAIRACQQHARQIGFGECQFYIEPKWQEPTAHQFDSNAATCLNFLREFELERIQLNLEKNHALLAHLSFQHELRVAADAKVLGSIDANDGDLLQGWDLDKFPTERIATGLELYEVLQAGGFRTGGVNFDAKVRRESFTVADLVVAHRIGMDTFAAGLKIAAALRADGRLERLREMRYAGWHNVLGQTILSCKSFQGNDLTLAQLREMVERNPEFEVTESGGQESIEELVQEVAFAALE